ncbi:hypothetical protein [Arenimonas sp. MALMAid1274]|uniref:hypothetical protein n=1 Tax=Arenimonas sp. MALMAid1274 TaxID=3411630 RepID=UPI003B9E778A
MSGSFPGALSRPALIAVPPALSPARLGPDLLPAIAEATPEASFESMLDGQAVLVSELAAHNAAPLAPSPASVAALLSKLDATRSLALLLRRTDVRDGRLFQLDATERPPRDGVFFTLRERIPFDPRQEERDAEAARAAQAQAEARQLATILAEGDAEAIDEFLEFLVLDRQNDLDRLRRLVDVHRDSVQNAVDIVQTKRIDFLESPQEMGLAGSAMAFVVTNLLAGVITSALGGVLQLILTGAFAITGGGFQRKRQASLTQFFAERRSSLTTLAGQLKGSQKQLARFDRGRRKSGKVLNEGLAKRAKAFQDFKPPVLEKQLALGSIGDDAISRAAALTKRLSTLKTNPDGTPDLVSKAGSVALAKPVESIARMMDTAAKSKPDAGNALAVPVDVAMKMEVQDYFEPWLQAAESSIAFLRLTRQVLRSTGDLPQPVLQELFESLGGNEALQGFSDEVESLTLDMPALRASLTSHYELLLWLTLYHQTIGKARRIQAATGPGSSREVIAIPAAPATRNLLRYLAFRHFDLGTLKPSGEVEFTDDELRGCLVGLEQMSQPLFAASATTVALPQGGTVPAVQVVSVRYD